MKKKLSREFKIGVFGVAIIALLYISINYIKSNRIFSSDKTFYGVFTNADGLEASAPVMTKGFRIGTVEKVSFDLNTQDIIVMFSVEKEYPLPVDTKIKIASSSLLGGKVLEVNYGVQHGTYFANKDTIPSVFEPSVSELISKEYGKIREKLTEYSVKIENVMSGMESLFDTTNVQNIKQTINNLDNVTGDLARIVHNRRSNLEGIINNLDSVALAIKEMTPDMKNTFANLSNASDSLPAVMTQINATFNNISDIVAKIDRGEGNLGKLVNDEAMYANITESLDNLKALIADVKENPKKYINVVVFPKKEKSSTGAKKKY